MDALEGKLKEAKERGYKDGFDGWSPICNPYLFDTLEWVAYNDGFDDGFRGIVSNENAGAVYIIRHCCL